MAIGADGVGVVAEVVDDLEEALLACGGVGQAVVLMPEHPPPGQTEEGVVLRLGPFEEAFPGHIGQRGVMSGLGPDPEPRENDIDREIGHAADAEQRLGLGEARGAQAPVPGPEIVLGHVQAGEERIGRRSFGFFVRKPFFQVGDEVFPGHPMSGQGEAALGLIGRAKAVEPPETARQDQSVEGFAFAPPMIPKATQINF